MLLALLGGSWLQLSASGFDRLCAGLLGFWEEEEEDEEEADTGRGGSISFLEDSEEGLGVLKCNSQSKTHVTAELVYKRQHGHQYNRPQ